MVVAFPCAVGLAVFGLPIFNILFSSTRATNAEASLMMYVGAVAVVFTRFLLCLTDCCRELTGSRFL